MTIKIRIGLLELELLQLNYLKKDFISFIKEKLVDESCQDCYYNLHICELGFLEDGNDSNEEN